jgi:hypothetical protein
MSGTAVIVVVIRVPVFDFTPLVQVRFATVLAGLLNTSFESVSIDSAVGIARRRVVAVSNNESSAGNYTRVTSRLFLSASECRAGSDKLSPSTISEGLAAANFSTATLPTVTITGCPERATISSLSTDLAPLPPALQQRVTTTTAVVAAVVGSVVAGTVTAATAGAIGVSLSSSTAGAAGSASPGASIYQLISAVQFMNVYGAMIGGGNSKSRGRRAADDLGTDSTNTTDSSMAAFRCLIEPANKSHQYAFILVQKSLKYASRKYEIFEKEQDS